MAQDIYEINNPHIRQRFGLDDEEPTTEQLLKNPPQVLNALAACFYNDRALAMMHEIFIQWRESL